MTLVGALIPRRCSAICRMRPGVASCALVSCRILVLGNGALAAASCRLSMRTCCEATIAWPAATMSSVVVMSTEAATMTMPRARRRDRRSWRRLGLHDRQGAARALARTSGPIVHAERGATDCHHALASGAFSTAFELLSQRADGLLSARGLRVISSALASVAPRVRTRRLGSAPHTHGKRGGHVHPPVAARRMCSLTRRSSPE